MGRACNNIGRWQSHWFSCLPCCSLPIQHSTTQLTIVWQMTWSLHTMPFMRMSQSLISRRDPSFSSHKVALCGHEKEKEEEILKGFGKAVQPIIGCVSSCPSWHEWKGKHRSLVMMQSCVDPICVQFHPTPKLWRPSHPDSSVSWVTPPKSQLLLRLSILLGEDGGGSHVTVLVVGHNSPSSPDTPHLGDLFLEEAWEDPPTLFFLKVTSRPQIQFLQKVIRNPNYLVVFFTRFWGSGLLAEWNDDITSWMRLTATSNSFPYHH